MRKLTPTVSTLFIVMALMLLSPAGLRAELKEVSLNGRTNVAPPTWIIQCGRLYMDQNNMESVDKMLVIMEDHLGINANGSLNIIKAWDCQYALSGDTERLLEEWQTENDESWLYYFKDYLSLTGLNNLYFRLCTTYKDAYADRFVTYFENGFYPNQSIFTKNAHYYQILYYYLLLTSGNVSERFSRAITFLNQNPNGAPSFLTKYDLRRFEIGVRVSAELDGFISQKPDATAAAYEQVFTDNERDWIKGTTGYFLSAQTHTALMSYDWIRRYMPLDASADAFAYSVSKAWKDQAVIYRTRLPLVFFTEEGEKQVNIETLFDSTVQKLRVDNRKVDLMMLTALEAWLTKQVRHGIKMEDRIKYNNILAELKACPSGWVFANLYDCRHYLAELELFAENWGTQRNQKEIFEKQVVDAYFNAKDRIDAIFNDLEKIFGKNYKPGPVNYIFNRYRGEVNYYFKYIQFETFQGKSNTGLPITGSDTNYLNDFKEAFLAAPNNTQNHINLLKGYNLLFRELAASGRIDEIQKKAWELETFLQGTYHLGERLSHEENSLFDIYNVITSAYLSYDALHAKALETAQKGFLLAKHYYAQAAEEAGYVLNGKIGAITRENTEMDDYQRQFELYRKVANKMGKKIRLMVSEDDVLLYNKMQAMSKQGI